MSIIIFIFILFKFSLNLMIFPFKQAFEHKNGAITMDSKEYNGAHYAIDYFNTKLYTEIKMGYPIQKIKILLAGELCAFKIGKSINCIYSDEYLSYYNRNDSKDFTYTSKHSMYDHEFNNQYGSTAEDTLYAYTDLKLENEKPFKNVGFYLGTDTSDKLCGIIGLENDNFVCQRIYNIVKDCKTKNYISNNKFMLKYTNSINEGLFIIGSEFKEVIDNYNENNTFTTQLSTRVDIYKFGFEINKATLLKKKGDEENEEIEIETNIPGEINNDRGLFVASPKYFEKFNESFFKYYLENKICTRNIYDNDPQLKISEKYSVIECDKAKFGENDLKKFPTFYLYVGEYFEEKKFFFDYKDLFTENNYKYFFNIIFDNSVRSKLEIGKIFLKKYPINFHLDDKILEIYDSYEQKPIDNNGGSPKPEKKNNTFLYVVIIILLIGITGVLGYFLGKYLNKIRKKRANELLDDFDYRPEIGPRQDESINS